MPATVTLINGCTLIYPTATRAKVQTLTITLYRGVPTNAGHYGGSDGKAYRSEIVAVLNPTQIARLDFETPDVISAPENEQTGTQME